MSDTNNTKTTEAISLRYDQSKDEAPIVTAKGEGKYAEDIIKMAEELGVYVHKDPVLLEHLQKLSEGDKIPKPLFMIISEIIVYSYYLQGKTPEHYTDIEGHRHINIKS